ncbi:YjfI family protein [Billgrantia sp. Q4P2]|uniref:YjfI family protein n=1 Tax=Billgrantia sp. Q4P2 TaxID=3463857 RepID=UPI0040566D00
MDTQDLTLHLSDTTYEGRHFHVMPIEGKEDVLQVTVSGAEEVPVYLTFDETQILFFTYLFDESEVTPERLPELLDSMLRLSVPLPLSALGKIEQRYVVHGALATSATYREIAQELTTLADNAIDLLEIFEEFLK